MLFDQSCCGRRLGLIEAKAISVRTCPARRPLEWLRETWLEVIEPVV